MKIKSMTPVLILAAALAGPGRAVAAPPLIALPAVGLVAGMIAGNIVGKSMGIAAFGTAISAKVPLAILGSVMGASLAAHLMPLVASVGPPTLSLAQGVLIALVTGAGTGAVVVLLSGK